MAAIAEAVAGLVGGLGNIGLGIYNTVQQQKVAQQNYELQKQAYEWNKYATENQHQIAARDLEAAGLSKTLAAGSANSAVNVGNAPQMDNVDYTQINPLGAISQMANLASTVAGMKLADEQAKTQMAQQDYIRQQTSNSMLDGFLKSFNNSKLDERYQMEKGRYNLSFADSLARNFNIYKRLEMDRLLNNARVKNLEQSTLNAVLEHDINQWDYDLAQKHDLPVRGRSFYGNLFNDIFGSKEVSPGGIFDMFGLMLRNAMNRSKGKNSEGKGHHR